VTDGLPQSVLDAADIVAVTQLCLTERESRDLGRWERMRGCFWPDSLVRISWFNGTGDEFVEGSIGMAKRGVLATHRLDPPAVRLNGDRATASFTGVIDIPTTIKGVEGYLSAYGRFLYRAERREGRWALAVFEGFYMRDEFVAAIPGQVPDLGPEELAGFRPSYRLLSWLLEQREFPVNSELPGADRPETVKAILDEIDAWLEHG
jgi:SnoaL-like domain